MKSHKEIYPEQYSNPLCGKAVAVLDKARDVIVDRGIVDRVVHTRFGMLAHLVDSGDRWYGVWNCQLDSHGN